MGRLVIETVSHKGRALKINYYFKGGAPMFITEVQIVSGIRDYAKPLPQCYS